MQAFKKIEKARGTQQLTYFEFTTLAALEIFSEKENNLDIALLEVGLGGRLDATNIVDPDISVITTIDLDHQAWLGTDRESIAYEKAGIMRRQKPVIYGDTNMPETIKSRAEEISAPLFEYNKNYFVTEHEAGWKWSASGKTRPGLPFPVIAGQHQIKNAATAIMVLELLQPVLPVSQQAIKSGILATKLPGRFQVLSNNPTVIIDVAHNPQATQALAATLQRYNWPGKTIAVAGLLQDKDIEQTLRPLVPITDNWYLADLSEVHQSRGAGTGLLETTLKSINDEAMITASLSPMAAYDAALEKAQPGDRVIVFGSFSTVGGILEKIQQRIRDTS